MKTRSVFCALAIVAFASSMGCKRPKATPAMPDASSSSSAKTNAPPSVVGNDPKSEKCETFVVVTGIGDPKSVCIKDLAAPFAIEIAAPKGAQGTLGGTPLAFGPMESSRIGSHDTDLATVPIDLKELVLETAQSELAGSGEKVANVAKRMPVSIDASGTKTAGELTIALSHYAARAVLEKMLVDFETGKTGNPFPKTKGPIEKGKAGVVLLHRPEHARLASDKETKPGGRLFMRPAAGAMVKDVVRVVIGRAGKETVNKKSCRYATLGSTERSEFMRTDVTVDLTTYDRGADASKNVKHLAPDKSCPDVIDMTEARKHYELKVLPTARTIIEYVQSL